LEQVAIPPAELDQLLRNASPAILVGGQALAFWIALYAVPIDDAPVAVVTKDADFLGSRDDAVRLARAVGRGRDEWGRDLDAGALRPVLLVG
jgi:hypothetical protein